MSMPVSDAIALAVVLTRELNALMLAYQKARNEGRDQLSDEETETFSVRADDAGNRLQLKIDNL